MHISSGSSHKSPKAFFHQRLKCDISQTKSLRQEHKIPGVETRKTTKNTHICHMSLTDYVEFWSKLQGGQMICKQCAHCSPAMYTWATIRLANNYEALIICGAGHLAIGIPENIILRHSFAFWSRHSLVLWLGIH